MQASKRLRARVSSGDGETTVKNAIRNMNSVHGYGANLGFRGADDGIEPAYSAWEAVSRCARLCNSRRSAGRSIPRSRVVLPAGTAQMERSQPWMQDQPPRLAGCVVPATAN
jgi:hypothetical protein